MLGLCKNKRGLYKGFQGNVPLCIRGFFGGIHSSMSIESGEVQAY